MIAGSGSIKLYTNDGNGNYTEVLSTPFKGVSRGSIAFADVDGDNDQDVLVIGGGELGKLYINDGTGKYTEVEGTPFGWLIDSSIAFTDIDGDNDQDVLITGHGYSGDISGDNISKLYINDGTGKYTEVTGTPFQGVSSSSIAFADVDGDNDQDVLITGYAGETYCSVRGRSKLYTNDGTGKYTQVTLFDGPFEGVRRGSVAFADIDGDNSQDLLVTGYNAPVETNHYNTKLFTNGGAGDFLEILGTPFEGVENSSIAFADVDGDNDQDVLITGSNVYLFGKIAKLYKNDGLGGFTEVTGTPFEGVDYSSIAFADVDGDEDQDVLITGSGISGRIAKLYTNDGNGTYTEVIGTPFEGVDYSSIAFADVDGDEDQDVLITGSGSITKLYTNDGNGNYTEVIGTPFEGIGNSSIAFADVDGDNDQDVLITGRGISGRIAKLYTNDGNGTYTEVIGTPFEGVENSSIAFADVDDDNDQDVLITGEIAYSEGIAKLYNNDGSGNYSEVIGTPFEGVYDSSIAFTDIDGDNDQDLFITGYNGTKRMVKLYRNNTSCPDKVWYLDADADGFAISTTTSCSMPGNGYTMNVLPLTDCDDNNPNINPGATEIEGDFVDNDCNNLTVDILNNDLIIGVFTRGVSNNNCDGMVDVSVENGIAPYTYNHSNGNNSNLVLNLCRGLYNVVVNDSKTKNTKAYYIIPHTDEIINNTTSIFTQESTAFEQVVFNCDLTYENIQSAKSKRLRIFK